MYLITKRFGFCAAHALDHLPASHKCAKLHGHNYEVEVALEALTLDENGMVADYNELDEFGAALEETCDHQNLNDVMETPTTAEHLAEQFYNDLVAMLRDEGLLERGVRVRCVRVSETPKTWAEYTP